MQDKELQETELAVDSHVSCYAKNLELKKELWARGYFVSEVNRGAGIEYLVVTTSPPQDTTPIDHTAN
jgi:hypothetical protein